jgi:predicted nucleotidyltransferase
VNAVAQIPRELAGYLDELVDAMAAVADLDAVYLIGSAAVGAYVPGESDVDVIAVTSRSLSLDERRRLAEAAESVPCPARKLELVVYPRGSHEWEINLNTGEHVSFETAAEPRFWFVLDRAIAEQQSLPLLGPPWADAFDPVPRDALLEALDESLEVIGALNMARAWAWLETGEWISKPAAEAWLRGRVHERIEEERR